jgi:hypothetical protein
MLECSNAALAFACRVFAAHWLASCQEKTNSAETI